MNIEQLKDLIDPIYVLLALILVALVFICLFLFFIVYDNEKCSEKKSLEERLKNKTDMDRLRYEHELLFREYKEKKLK